MSPPVVHPADRTVVVTAIQQGSGVLLTDRLVLTCAHVVKSGSVLIAHPAISDRVRATVAWIDYRLDVALLEAVEPVRPVPPVRLGVVDTRQAIPECEITGFPRVQRYGRDQRLEADQYTATVLPLAGRVRDLLVCDLDGPPAARPDDEPPPLAGLSGGPVFMGDVLLGIARQVPQQRDGRRVECVPLAPVLAAAPFRLVYRRTGVDLREERVHGSFPRDLRYEAEYAKALGVAYRRTKIFGLDELSRHDTEWDLDTAYLSLEAVAQTETQDRAAQHPGGAAQHPGVTEAAPPLPKRIDALLADRPRVLLRGEAGAGKTTLLWWLAAHASARTLGDALTPLNGLIPFVVPLRTLRARGVTFPAPAELPSAADLVVDTAPEGWAGRVLESGRALLLVDGLDEVPPEDREQTHTWLARLLARYPDTRCVATVRPLAVDPDWLRSEGFAELRLLPMRSEDIQAFVASWHRAALLSEPDDAERLDELERDLSHQFDQNPTLRDLARTPLLCAVICALHRRRDGFLPETRWKLYRSALEMLLGHRDHRRRIGSPEGIDLDVEESTQLLQRIAVWLVREGQSEFTRDQALRQLDRALAGMERVGAQGPPEKILTHLLNRSGLLQEHTDDTYQFIHRTFQDYLAAKELIEDDHLGELLRHAVEEPWQDVVLLASGHCGRRELGLLVEGLLDRGLACEEASLERMDLHVLAALCAQHAAWLDGALRERVHRSTAELFPPMDTDEVNALVRLGRAALEFLPDPATVKSGDGTVECAVDLIVEIGGAAAVPHARSWLSAHPGLGVRLAYAWESFPPEEYASEVLARCDLSGSYPLVSDRRRLAALRHLGDLRYLHLEVDAPDAEIAAALEGKQLHHLVMDDNASLTGFACLRPAASSLTYLRVKGCPGIRDLAALGELTALRTLCLEVSALPTAHIALSTVLPAALESLELTGLAADRLSEIAPHPPVVDLVLVSRRPLVLDALGAWPSLTALEVSELSDGNAALTALAAHPRITDLTFRAFPWQQPPTGAPALPTVEELSVQPPRGGRVPAFVRAHFPGVAHLTLDVSDHAGGLDLSAVADWPGLTVTVSGREQISVVGAEGLGDRLTVTRY
ncbi:NACHT domain-containing protein [Streptomyces sp. NPDC020755]|uniref:NACHT domain-containing protein n=1 Tax=Streptomyces sp. NPDC020755 TaxID=3154790 RepID=UPI003405957B